MGKSWSYALGRMRWTPEKIEAICQLGRDPSNWVPAGPEEIEQARRIADDMADAYTDDDWRYLLNVLSPIRAASEIADRPPEDRNHLLSLLNPAQRASVESHLVSVR